MFLITKWCATITDGGEDQIINEQPKEMPFTFRLKDDDGEIYAYGCSDDCSSEKAFEPLDRYAADYGVTSIEYYNKDSNEWEVL